MYETMIKLIKSAVLGKKDGTLKKPSEQELYKLFKLAHIHRMLHLVAQGYMIYEFFGQNKTKIEETLSQSLMNAVVRHEQQKYELIKIAELFERLKVDFIFLKGAVLRDYYPQPWMRMSCDIDILVKPEAVALCVDKLKLEYGYAEGRTGEYDISLTSPSGVHLELHYGLMEERFQASKTIDLIWDSAVPIKDGSHQLNLTDDVFYYYQLIHLAKHFESSGCGVRFFLDIWVMNHNNSFNKTEKSEEYLEAVGLSKFEKNVVHLSEVWFSSVEHTELSKRMQEYVLSSGIYGSTYNYMATLQIKAGGKNKYAASRIFLPYKKLVSKYPSLECRKILMPFYQIKRWIDVLCQGRLRQSKDELVLNSKITKERVEFVGTLLRDLDFISDREFKGKKF